MKSLLNIILVETAVNKSCEVTDKKSSFFGDGDLMIGRFFINTIINGILNKNLIIEVCIHCTLVKVSDSSRCKGTNYIESNI